MKGPYERLKYDLRRVWECPVCHHSELIGGEATFALCACQQKLEPAEQVGMRLIHEGGRRADSSRQHEHHPSVPLSGAALHPNSPAPPAERGSDAPADNDGESNAPP